VIPADNKLYMQERVADIIYRTISDMASVPETVEQVAECAVAQRQQVGRIGTSCGRCRHMDSHCHTARARVRTRGPAP
jgi:hypothetical protein